jgi:hypothetical protein
MKRLKYIRHSSLGFVVFPEHINFMHYDMAVSVNREMRQGSIMSAGFIGFDAGKPFCHGRSESLNLGAGPTDTQDLRTEWGIQE